MSNNLTTKSKFLSLVLRHDPKKIGIVLDQHGWANVAELCEKMPISKDDLNEIVRTDSKGRYSYSEDGLKIRANQGHSIDVDVELEELMPPEFLWHGTATKSLGAIFKDGLLPMSRLYVHLSADKETALKVGSRHGTPAILKVQALNMYNGGQKFFRSKNGVWLVRNVQSRWFSEEKV
jgi:putative RNA 2'-phosphotransferase